MKNKKPIEIAPVVVKKRVQHGAYTYKPIVSVIAVCSCGGKYIKTRVDQTKCIRCINEPNFA